MNGSLSYVKLRETKQPQIGEKQFVICSPYLDKPTLVDELTDRLQVGASVGDVGLCKLCPNFLFAFTQGEDL